MPRLSMFMCTKAKDRLDYVAVRLKEGNYQVIKCRYGTEDGMIPKPHEIINPTYHNAIV